MVVMDNEDNVSHPSNVTELYGNSVQLNNQSQLKISHLNVNGWTEANNELWTNIVNELKSNIIGISETHLIKD